MDAIFNIPALQLGLFHTDAARLVLEKLTDAMAIHSFCVYENDDDVVPCKFFGSDVV